MTSKSIMPLCVQGVSSRRLLTRLMFKKSTWCRLTSCLAWAFGRCMESGPQADSPDLLNNSKKKKGKASSVILHFTYEKTYLHYETLRYKSREDYLKVGFFPLKIIDHFTDFTVLFLKQLNGTFHFVLILAAPVDKGGSVSPNVRLHVPSASLLAARRLLHREESGRQLQRRTFS